MHHTWKTASGEHPDSSTVHTDTQKRAEKQESHNNPIIGDKSLVLSFSGQTQEESRARSIPAGEELAPDLLRELESPGGVAGAPQEPSSKPCSTVNPSHTGTGPGSCLCWILLLK